MEGNTTDKSLNEGNTTDESRNIDTSKRKEPQKQPLRLRIVLLFYDERKGVKLDNDDYYITQYGYLYKDAKITILGDSINTSEQIIDNKICIKERLFEDKKKYKDAFDKFQDRLKNIINSYYQKDVHEEIYLDFLIPKDNNLGIITDIYQLFLFDKNFINDIKSYPINLKKSSVSILYPEIDKEGSSQELPNNIDAKMAAIMSHYVYFYLDWLEYVHVHVGALVFWEHDLKKYKTNEKKLVDEFNLLTSPSFAQIPLVGAGKVKARIVGRLKEIAKIVNFSTKIITDSEITCYIDSYKNCEAEDESKIVDKIIAKVLKPTIEYQNEVVKKIITDKLDKIKKVGLLIKLLTILRDSINITYTSDVFIQKQIEELQRMIKNLCKELDNIWAKPINVIFRLIRSLLSPPQLTSELFSVTLKSIHSEIDSLIKDKSKREEEKEIAEFKKLLDEICAIEIYVDILSYCKEEGRPIGFYDLYEKFGYWDYLKDDFLKEEAKKWYVSHPYWVYKNDCDQIYNNSEITILPSESDLGINVINDDATKAYDKILLVSRKTYNVFISKNHYKKRDKEKDNSKEWIATGNYLIYNTVLTHGMDQFSGYGGLLFTKVEFDAENKKLIPLKFAYCTKGTDVNSINDWILADFLQGASGFSLQHVHNVKNAITINEKVKDLSRENNIEIPLIFCGHSLGGGLASAGAIACKGRHAITFNAAGLNFLGVVATRTLGGFNYSYGATKMVHPIRIDGEAIDVIMLITKLLLLGLNERAYGSPELIFKLKKNEEKFNMIDLSECGAKHGINNFLYKPLMNALEIVEEGTIKASPKDSKETSIATLGLDSDTVSFETYKVQPSMERGNYIIKFDNIDLPCCQRFISVYKYNIHEQLTSIIKLNNSILTSLKNTLFWEAPN